MPCLSGSFGIGISHRVQQVMAGRICWPWITAIRLVIQLFHVGGSQGIFIYPSSTAHRLIQIKVDEFESPLWVLTEARTALSDVRSNPESRHQTEGWHPLCAPNGSRHLSASAKQARRESGGNPVSRSSVYEHFLLFRKCSGTISEGAQLVGGTDEGPLP
jgi:hypothetical protein